MPASWGLAFGEHLFHQINQAVGGDSIAGAVSVLGEADQPVADHQRAVGGGRRGFRWGHGTIPIPASLAGRRAEPHRQFLRDDRRFARRGGLEAGNLADRLILRPILQCEDPQS